MIDERREFRIKHVLDIEIDDSVMNYKESKLESTERYNYSF